MRVIEDYPDFPKGPCVLFFFMWSGDSQKDTLNRGACYGVSAGPASTAISSLRRRDV